MPLPARPAIPVPNWLISFYSIFPLVTYPSPPTTTTPTVPTLWLLGPPPSTSPSSSSSPSSTPLSLDPACRIAQVLARFTYTEVQVEWWTTSAGGVGARLPNVHLSDGSLLSHEDLADFFLAPPSSSAGLNPNEKPKEKGTPAPADAVYLAFQSLLRSALLPAALLAVYLAHDAPPVVAQRPEQAQPLLSGWAQRAIDWSERREMVKEVGRLRGGKSGGLDAEEVEREAIKALDAFEDKMAETAGEDWFDGAK